ncbi:hypothetical protein Ancab_006723, partial [Ancistrocladus abbreviatus]
ASLFKFNVGEMLSNAIITSSAEGSPDSNNPNSVSHRRRRSRNDGHCLSSSTYKGVVPQRNGHWGAQIYSNHQRIWLGTFKTERDAAMAYDSAAVKLRCGESRRNIAYASLAVHEPFFQEHYSAEEVLHMIKDSTYQTKLLDFVRSQPQKTESKPSSSFLPLGWHSSSSCDRILYQKLFEKELTPSDIGKLNRLVIPKKYAIKFFPVLCESKEEKYGDGDGVESMELAFYDQSMKTWKFRYCYWKSSQSYVFTRGWNSFTKEKDLKTNGIVIFYKVEVRDDDEKELHTFCVIDVKNRSGDETSGVAQSYAMLTENEFGVGPSCCSTVKDGWDVDGRRVSMGEEVAQEKGVRLFGVRIG